MRTFTGMLLGEVEGASWLFALPYIEKTQCDFGVLAPILNASPLTPETCLG